MWVEPKHKPMYPYIPVAHVGNGCYAVPFMDDPVWEAVPAEPREELFRRITEAWASLDGMRLVWASPWKPTHYPCAYSVPRVLGGCHIE